MFRTLGRVASEFCIQNVIVWVKSLYVEGRSAGHFKPINSPRYVNNTHEYVLHVTERGDAPIDRLAVGVPYEDASNISRFAKAAGGLRCRGSVWHVPYRTRKDRPPHPATYPVELAEMMIRLAGDAPILDPFVGSGTTLVAAKRLGLAATGFDLSPGYVALARERLAAA